MKRIKCYVKPRLEVHQLSLEQHLLNNSGVNNDELKIMDGGPDYDNLIWGNGSDAG